MRFPTKDLTTQVLLVISLGVVVSSQDALAPDNDAAQQPAGWDPATGNLKPPSNDAGVVEAAGDTRINSQDAGFGNNNAPVVANQLNGDSLYVGPANPQNMLLHDSNKGVDSNILNNVPVVGNAAVQSIANKEQSIVVKNMQDNDEQLAIQQNNVIAEHVQDKAKQQPDKAVHEQPKSQLKDMFVKKAGYGGQKVLQQNYEAEPAAVVKQAFDSQNSLFQRARSFKEGPRMPQQRASAARSEYDAREAPVENAGQNNQALNDRIGDSNPLAQSNQPDQMVENAHVYDSRLSQKLDLPLAFNHAIVQEQKPDIPPQPPSNQNNFAQQFAQGFIEKVDNQNNEQVVQMNNVQNPVVNSNNNALAFENKLNLINNDLNDKNTNEKPIYESNQNEQNQVESDKFEWKPVVISNDNVVQSNFAQDANEQGLKEGRNIAKNAEFPNAKDETAVQNEVFQPNKPPKVLDDRGINEEKAETAFETNAGKDRESNVIAHFLKQHAEGENTNQETVDKLNELRTIDNHVVVQKSQTGIKPNQNVNLKNAVDEDSHHQPIVQPKLSLGSNENAAVQDTGANGGGGVKPHFKFISDKAATGANKDSMNPIGGTGVDYVPAAAVKRTAVPPPPPKPTPKSRPDVSMRKDVIWYSEYHSYSLRASIDDRFRIRYAPIPAPGTPWPKPQFYNSEHTVYFVNPFVFGFNSAGESCDVLDFSLQRVQRLMFGDALGEIGGEEDEGARVRREWYAQRAVGVNATELRGINVTVLRECSGYPHLDMDESYDLEVRASGVVLIAREVWGALRGLETFSQMVYQNERALWFVNKTLIHDFPRFKHRGILLDTSRHYLSPSTILLNLEAMAQNKMNVLHWHIVDEQSFPFVSHTYPNLTKFGAYDAHTHVYTHETIAEIIEEARVRGIRVIPEFDTPGHTFAWGLGVDNLLTPCYNYRGEPDGYFGPINPILKSTYKFLEGLFTEVLGLFKDKYVHLGGDEVPLDCWNTNPSLQRFMNRNNLYDVKDLLNVYTKKLVDIIANIGAKREQGSGYIVWQEVFDDGVKLKPDAIVQIWKGNAWDIDRVTSRGLRALFSSCWYLDYISYGMDWDKYYQCNQVMSDLDIYNVRNQSLLMGGDVCMWAEFADDENILPRIWPRASAAAERLWSSKSVNDIHEAGPRIEEHRCRMKKRGIPVGVLGGPGHCAQYPMGDSAQTAKPKPFSFLSNFYNKPANSFNKNVYYTVDMNSMYVIPLLLIVAVLCLTLVAALQDSSKSRLLAILPIRTSSKRGFRGLLYVFMVFTIVWCIWTAPIWMNSWENHSSSIT